MRVTYNTLRVRFSIRSYTLKEFGTVESRGDFLLLLFTASGALFRSTLRVKVGVARFRPLRPVPIATNSTGPRPFQIGALSVVCRSVIGCGLSDQGKLVDTTSPP